MAELITYFSNVNTADSWTDTANAVDNNTGTVALATGVSTLTMVLDTPASTSSGDISKVEIRIWGCISDIVPSTLTLTPVFEAGNGDDEAISTRQSSDWSDWFDITEDTNAPSPWTWADITTHTAVNVKYSYGSGGVVNGECGCVQLRVTYTGDSEGNKKIINNYYY